MWGFLSGLVGLLNWLTGWGERRREDAARRQGEDEYKPTIAAVKEREQIDDQVDRASDASVHDGLQRWRRDQ